ncbi:restriction endonuclease subunit S [Helicobacter mehlei]|uniref:Restriction endonuclease subunit S n=1 Tax=Helicobacter mehlei TaxID=2316080 RepID=A0A553V2Z3_9HELI|nr:restriction endonuclease subunit S [Helicobacter mehlei]TSA86601.1 restriction endonuclease subunit S [Helicobacter mehlei]
MQNLPSPPVGGWKAKRLKDVAFYPQDRISTDLLTPSNYVGVDNLLQDKKGKIDASFILEKGGTTNAYMPNDILISNIRPYLKKIWFADTNGGTNNDVIVLRPKDVKTLAPRFLYYLLSDDGFFEYEMRHTKGLKMPRGDKGSVLDYQIPLPPLETQEQIISVLTQIEQEIARLDAEIATLQGKEQEILQEFLGKEREREREREREIAKT